MCTCSCASVCTCMCKCVHGLLFPSSVCWKHEEAKAPWRRRQWVHFVSREWFLIFATKRNQDYSEKWLVPRLGQGKCKMSLDAVVKPENKVLYCRAQSYLHQRTLSVSWCGTLWGTQPHLLWLEMPYLIMRKHRTQNEDCSTFKNMGTCWEGTLFFKISMSWNDHERLQECCRLKET